MTNSVLPSAGEDVQVVDVELAVLAGQRCIQMMRHVLFLERGFIGETGRPAIREPTTRCPRVRLAWRLAGRVSGGAS